VGWKLRLQASQWLSGFTFTPDGNKIVSYQAQRMFHAGKIINFAVLHLIRHRYKSTGLAQIRRHLRFK
jgi:hypothetical protein